MEREKTSEALSKDGASLVLYLREICRRCNMKEQNRITEAASENLFSVLCLVPFNLISSRLKYFSFYPYTVQSEKRKLFLSFEKNF